jgi:hypothetical protein
VVSRLPSAQGVQSGSVGSSSVDEGAGDKFANEGNAVATNAQVPVLTEVKSAAPDLGVPR